MRKRVTLSLLAAAGAIAAASSLAPFGGSSGPQAGAYLVTVRPEGGAPGIPGKEAPTTIALTSAAGRPRFLLRDFYSAGSPSPDFDGRRVVFAGRRRPDEVVAIWEVAIDGTGVRKVTGGHGSPQEPAFLPGGRIVFSDVPEEAAEAAAGVRSLFSCAPDGGDLRRLTFAPRRDESPEVLTDGRLRFRSRSLAPDDSAEAMLMTVHPDGTQIAAFPAGLSAQEPVIAATAGTTPVAAHPSPRILTSLVDESRPTGTLLCLDVYASRLKDIAGLPRGAIGAVRLSRVRAGAPAGGEAADLLGDVPVEEDGSFFATVPADVPLRLALLSRDGKALGALWSGIWVRPNENRGCIGCHEEPDRAPENRRPLAVLHEPSSPRPAGASEKRGS